MEGAAALSPSEEELSLENPERMEQTAGSVLLLYIFDARSELIATGSGFLMFDNRTLVTNCHVIEDADSVWGGIGLMTAPCCTQAVFRHDGFQRTCPDWSGRLSR